MKTNQNHNRIAEAFDKLFRTYPQFGQGDTPEAVTRDRVEKARVYFDAVALYEETDVEAAVNALLHGTAPGVNPNFTPPAPVVASECRRQMNIRLDAAHRERALRPALPPPDIVTTDEERERVKAMVEAFVSKASAAMRTEDAEAERRKLALLGRTNETFAPNMSERAIAKRLGFTVGDPDGDREVA